jgi:hypothetical protein
MMMKTNPITPPPELVEQWLSEHYGAVSVAPGEATSHVATEAARWGADQELEACCEWLDTEKILTKDGGYIRKLRIARRPKPLSSKERALADLDSMSIEPCLINGIDANALVRAKYDNIRRALEALDD